jgi:hypothetical protein
MFQNVCRSTCVHVYVSCIIDSKQKRNAMKNCNVSHSKESGLYVRDGGLMTIDGNGTTVHHNGTNGYGYGLRTYNSSSIHLVSPLTKELRTKIFSFASNKGSKNINIK